tara:strand:+ start:184 stop:417 length:234 start_codon:yes stop_codon:yes gene_type:complete
VPSQIDPIELTVYLLITVKEKTLWTKEGKIIVTTLLASLYVFYILPNALNARPLWGVVVTVVMASAITRLWQGKSLS